ncbi:hypothetical protein MYMA111404_03670 [Mycoplasma marinum]|uniref:Uncharacterized protein n=1 Tax=Mycoplasma marinum TaxID=1937190 RepID=A0A4R0XW16_9MOLU|nr:hypothetical protein [Mycoplasma marinum]TCG11151.1 hypothetical protein C4B24_03055 [Mycoplasma marinum]
MPNHFKQNKILPIVVFLISAFISLFSFIWNDQIVDFENKHHVTWVVIIIVFAVIDIINSAMFLIFKKLSWNKNTFSKIFFIFLNICSMTTILFLALPIVFNNTKLHWMIAILVGIKIVEILSILFFKNVKNAVILKWIFTLIVTVIPILVGVVLHIEKIWEISTTILIWECASMFIEFNYDNKDYIYERTILNRNPFYQNGMQFFILIFFWFIMWGLIMSAFDKNND